MSLNGLHFCMENSSPSVHQLQYKKSCWGIDSSESTGPVLLTVSSFLSPLFFLNYRFYGNIIALTAQKSLDCRCTSDNTFFLVVQMEPKSCETGSRGGKLPESSHSASARPGRHRAGCTGPVCLPHVLCTPLSKRDGHTDWAVGQWVTSASQPKTRHLLQHLCIVTSLIPDLSLRKMPLKHFYCQRRETTYSQVFATSGHHILQNFF